MSKSFNPWLLVHPFILIFAINFLIIGENLHLYLANSFLKSSLSLVKLPPLLLDLTYFNNQYFLPFGLFPATVLTPLVVIFGTNFQESFIKFPFTLFNFWLVFQITKALKLSFNKSIYLSIFFIFGSIYTPVATIPFSAYLSQVIATFLILLAVYEFLTKRRYFLIGIAVAFAILTRITFVTSSIFFLIFLLKKPSNPLNIIKFSLPIAAAIILFGFYNLARFGNILENGYKHQIITEEAATRKEQGLFSAKHIPANLYYMLLKTPDPVLLDDSHVLKPPYLRADYYGMSIFFLSPVLFLLFKTNFKDRLVKACFLAIILMLVPLLTYYGIGARQIGYRYALDFYPFLLIPLAIAIKKIDEILLKFLVIAGVMITWFFTIEMLLGF